MRPYDAWTDEEARTCAWAAIILAAGFIGWFMATGGGAV
jgi:hypothetical protein